MQLAECAIIRTGLVLARKLSEDSQGECYRLLTLRSMDPSGYILVDKDGYITLTDTGREVAEKIYERHTVLSRMLIALGVSEQTALEDACRVEHAISDETFEAIKRHVKNI